MAITSFHLMVQYFERVVVGCRTWRLISKCPPLIKEVKLKSFVIFWRNSKMGIFRTDMRIAFDRCEVGAVLRTTK